MNKDATDIDVPARKSASPDAENRVEGTMSFAFIVLGALAFPLVFVTALVSGMQLFLSLLVAFALAGPVALTLYLVLALSSGRSS